MNAFNNSMAADISPLKKMEMKLEKEPVGGKHKKAADFSEAYPIIEQHLARKVPVSVVIEAFSASYGYTLHAPRFRKLLEAERKRRAEDDDELSCQACGKPLKLPDMDVDVEATSVETTDDETNDGEGEA